MCLLFDFQYKQICLLLFYSICKYIWVNKSLKSKFHRDGLMRGIIESVHLKFHGYFFSSNGMLHKSQNEVASQLLKISWGSISLTQSEQNNIDVTQMQLDTMHDLRSIFILKTMNYKIMYQFRIRGTASLFKSAPTSTRNTKNV